jgi:hypothetical protein
MARRTAPAPRPAIRYTHKDTGTTLTDVCATEAGAVVYGDMLEATGHRDVELVMVQPIYKGKIRDV